MPHQFDPWQQEVIEIAEGRHLVLAPPGCGKTDILTERVVYAHSRGVAYDDMLCLTFTNRAAKGMASRIALRTQAPVPDELYVGNIHRFCSGFLFREGIINRRCTVIDEADVENIIQEDLCHRFGIQSRTTELMRYQHALYQASLGMEGDEVLHADLLRSPTLLKMCDVLNMPRTPQSLGHLYSHIDALCQQHASIATMPGASTMRLASAYQQYKEVNDLLDYDDLLVLTYQALSHPEPEHHFRRYSWIEIDEVQDLNPLQLILVDLIATDDATIVYLGDEQQAIFSFIGAKVETLQQLRLRCEPNLHRLHRNYRSPAYLLDLQNEYAALNLGISPELLPPSPQPVPRRDEDLCLLDVGEAQLEPYYTARFAARYGQLDPAGRVAILVSTNREADEVGETMLSLGIPHFKISGTDLFSHPTVRLLLAHATVLTSEHTAIAWARLLWGLGITHSCTEARRMTSEMYASGLLPTDFLTPDRAPYLEQFLTLCENEEYVIFDTETTGLDPTADDIIQIAAIRVRHGKVVGEPFEILLRSDREIPAEVGGHPNPMLEVYQQGPLVEQADGLRRFMQFCRGCTLVGHNVEFDYAILDHSLRRHVPSLRLEELCPHRIDTLKIARIVRPRLHHYRLADLLQSLHLEGENSHRATDDILATLALLRYLHRAARPLVERARSFTSRHQRALDRFCSRYATLYHEACAELDTTLSLDALLDRDYHRLIEQKRVQTVDKWAHLMHYLQADLIRTNLFPTLRSQLLRYCADLCTAKEADLCSDSLQEQFIISTVHKAKGLEFDTVIVYHCIDGIYPSQHSFSRQQQEEDARKLFVAISRSRSRLMVVCDSHFHTNPHHLSPFLDPLRHRFTLFRRTPDGKIVKV